MYEVRAEEMWDRFIKKNKLMDCSYDEWSFGVDADVLAHLVVTGQKIATSSAYPLYELKNEQLPQKGEYNVILDSNNDAVCIIQTQNVEIISFNEITPEHAYKEGEGDRSLDYWKKVHEDFFSKCMRDEGLEFTGNMKVVFEEFVVVYKL